MTSSLLPMALGAWGGGIAPFQGVDDGGVTSFSIPPLTPLPLTSCHTIRMAYDPDMCDDDDADALKAAARAELEALRARLRAKAARLVEVIETMGDPETVPDAWRAVRLVRQADAMVVQLYADPEAVMPGMARRTATSSRMAEAVEQEVEARLAHRQRKTDEMLRAMRALTVGEARDRGFWPNGEVFDKDDGSDDRLGPSVDYHLPPPQDIHDHFRQYILRRVNASTHHQAKASGQWPDGAPFDPEAENPGYYSISEGEQYRTSDEDYPIKSMPWWFVRKRPPQTAPP